MSDPMTTAPNNVLVRCWQALWIDRDTHTALGVCMTPMFVTASTGRRQ